jgi:hypothetical protein
MWQGFEPAVWLYGRILILHVTSKLDQTWAHGILIVSTGKTTFGNSVERDHSNLSDCCMSNVKTPSALHRNLLVGGFKHFLFSIIYGMSSFPLTNIFQDGYCTTNQLATSGLKAATVSRASPVSFMWQWKILNV